MSDDTSRDDGIIQVMSDRLANKIAAGEVVQRPASVAKELIENAVDAGASSVDLIVKDAGSTLVQVIDDGCGMSRADARRCFERHATSKIRSIEDLDRIRTLGFRGEALASIASIAQVELKTRRVEDDTGTLVRVDGGEITDVRPCATPPGTSIAVRNLFFNVPARRNFLKTPATELKHLTDTFQFLALANPDIAFRMEHKGNDLYDLPVATASAGTGAVPNPDALRQRIVDLFHLDDDADLVAVDDATGDLTVSGFTAHPSRARRKKKSEQFLFVNERYVQDRYLSHAVRKAYGDSLPEKTFPFFALFLGMDPRRVDVNVHPTKAEVKFDDQGGIYGFLKGAVRKALGRIQLTPQFTPSSGEQDGGEGGEQDTTGETSGDDSSGPLRSSSAPTSFQPRGTSDDGPPAMPNRSHDSSETSASGGSSSSGSSSGGSSTGRSASSSGRSASGSSAERRTSGGGGRQSSRPSARSGSSRSGGSGASPGDLSRKLYGTKGDSSDASSDEVSTEEDSAAHDHSDARAADDGRTVWSLHGRYLLSPTDAGLMMVDQRAAHVRILYERALDRLDEGSGESQQLLFPQTVDLDPADADLLDEWADELRALGFDLERMSGRTVAVRGVPADVRSDRDTSILQDVLATLQEEGRPSRSDRHQHLARSLAQQGAIPHGRTLAPPERRALLRDLMNCDMPYADPSGTPTILNLSMEEIEKRFRG